MSEVAGEFVSDRIMRCPYLPKRQHGDGCSLCHGSGEVPVKEVPPRLRLLPPSLSTSSEAAALNKEGKQ